MLKSKRFWIGLGLTVATLVIAFQGIQFDQLVHAFTQFNPIYLPLALLVFALSFGGRVFRWQLLFYPYHLRWSQVLGALSIGYFLSNVTPLRVGDVVRAYLLASLGKVPFARSLSTVVVERTCDGLTIVFFLILLLPFVPNLPPGIRDAAAVLGITGVALLVVLAIVSLQKERGVAFLRRITSPIKFLQRDSIWRGLDNLIDGFAVLHSPRPIIGVALWSIEIWFFAAVLNWVMMRAMGLDLPFQAAVLVMVVTSLAVTAAPTPGQLGVFHLATKVALNTVYGVSEAQALAYAFVIHGFVYLLLMILGIISLWREGLSLTSLRRVDVTAETEANAPVASS